MRTAAKDPTLAERTERLAAGLAFLAARLRSGELGLDEALDQCRWLASLRVLGGICMRLARVDLAYQGLELADRFRAAPAPDSAAGWTSRLNVGRRLLWHLLAAGEARAARLLSSDLLAETGPDFERLRAALPSEDFQLSTTLETLAELAYVGGNRNAFDGLGAETVYDRAPSSDGARFAFRGSLVQRAAYTRLPAAGDRSLDRFRSQVLDELAVHAREMAARDADSRLAAPFRLSGLIVLGCRAGLTVRQDVVPPESAHYLSLVAHLLT